MDYEFLSNTLLFKGISPDEICSALECLSAEQKSFQKGSIIHSAGSIVQTVGMVLSGSVCIENNDIWGNKSILDNIPAGFVFAETYACIPNEPIMVDVVAAENTEVLFLNLNRMFTLCSNTCNKHSLLLKNLLIVSSQKNISLSRRIFHTSSKSIRGRLLSYLSFQAAHEQSIDFVIPFNRQQLADYLNVDRSALSNELSKMQAEGLLIVNKSHFRLNENPVWNDFV